MKRSVSELGDLVDEKFYENSDQNILGSDANEVFIDFCDSFAAKNQPVNYYDFRVRVSDLDVNKSVTINHTLNNTNVKPVFYTNEGGRVWREYITFQIIDSDNVKLTFVSGIPFNTYIKGYFYLV